jgi:hypothetical protein
VTVVVAARPAAGLVTAVPPGAATPRSGVVAPTADGTVDSVTVGAAGDTPGRPGYSGLFDPAATVCVVSSGTAATTNATITATAVSAAPTTCRRGAWRAQSRIRIPSVISASS